MTDDQLMNLQISLGEDVLRREVGDELILLNLETEAYYGLNLTGRSFVDGVIAGATPSQAAAQIARDHSEPGEPVLEDMLVLLRELLDAGLVEPAV